MIIDNQVLIITQCDDGDVTNPKIDRFADDINADEWHHIAVPPMSTEDFYALLNEVHVWIQRIVDARQDG